MPTIQTQTSPDDHGTKTRYTYRTIDELAHLHQPSGTHWCFYGVIKFIRQSTSNCMMIGVCDPTSYGKGPKGASCLLFYESFAGIIELPVQAEIGQIIRLHRMKITSYRPESGCLQLKSSNYYSWLLFNGKSDDDDDDYDPIGQSSIYYSFSENDHKKIDELRDWLLSFPDDKSMRNELDFQSDLTSTKRFHHLSTQQDRDQSDPVRGEHNQDESTPYYSAPSQ